MEKFKVNMGISPTFLQEILTKDISTLDAIYDLIDNSIDAARNELFQSPVHQTDDFGLPTSYKGYEIELFISNESISIKDNCSGISRDEIINNVFIIANPSDHSFGIGQYGIGLKRSLMKIGNHYQVETSDGQESSSLKFSKQDIGNGSSNIYVLNTKNNNIPKFTIFTVSNLDIDIKNDICNQKWYEKILTGLQNRYSIYISKGLSISLKYMNNKKQLFKPHLPSIRKNALVQPITELLKINGVRISIEAGIHDKYTFTSENNYSRPTNNKLTNDYGIYFICNDRVIVSASTNRNHGWETKWHSEYNGFVCLVKFISEDPSKLPWNTSKSDMRDDASLFLDVIDKLQPIAEQYRSEIKKRYPAKNRAIDVPTAVSTSSRQRPPATITPSSNNATPAKPITPSLYTQPISPAPIPKPTSRLRETLIDPTQLQIRVPDTYTSSYNIFCELCSLNSKTTPIACVVLLRVFIEETIKTTLSIMNEKLESKKVNLSTRTMKVAEKLLESEYIDTSIKHLIKTYCASNNNNGEPEPTLFSFDAIQSQIHSKRFHPEQNRVNTYWTELDPFLAACWRYIAENDTKN